VITTARNKKEAMLLTKKALDMKLASGVSMQKIESYFKDGAKVKKMPEVRVIFETKKVTYPKLEDMIMKTSIYELPSVVAIEIKEGNKDYLRWIDTSVI
jgi:uncharacterized protein involved in tolerance to divalent cations